MPAPSFHAGRRRAVFAALVLAIAGAPAVSHAERVIGSGKPASQTRAVSGYDGVLLSAPFKVTLRAAGREGVELRGDSKLLPLVETRIVEADGQRALELRWRPGVSMSNGDAVELTVDLLALRQLSVAGAGEVTGHVPASPALAVRLAGSGEIDIRGIKSDQLAIALSGSGELKAAGRATRLSVALSGSGDVDTDALDAEEVSVQLAGSGDAAVAAHKSLAVAIAGSGDVVYRGAAQPRLSIAGSGSVKRR